MGSKVGLGDIRGLLVDTDKRPVLRLLPQMDSMSRGYALSHLGDAGCSIEDIADQVWLLNATDWMREQKKISWNLCKDLDDSGLDRVLHEFALKIVENFLIFNEKQVDKRFKGTWDLLQIKRKWLEGEVSDKTLDNTRDADWAAYSAASSAADWAAYRAADRAAYWAAYSAADRAAYWATDRAAEQKKQLELLGEMLEDSVGIERGVEG